MEARIVEFAELLRQNGMQTSPSEVMDAARALAEVGLEDRETVRAALAATLSKRAADRGLFHSLFELYFSGMEGLLAGLEESALRRIEEEGIFEGDEWEMLLHTLQDMKERLSPLTRAALEGEAGQVARLFRGAALQLDFEGLTSPSQAGFFSRRLAAAAGLGKARGDLDELAKRLEERGIDPAKVERAKGRLSERLRAVEEAARRYVKREAALRKVGAPGGEESDLKSRPFSSLSKDELERIQVAVERLAQRLKSRLVRKEQRRRGTLHVQRTLRRNMGVGGTPVDLVFRERRPQRPDVVVLCDLSDSVRDVSGLMLLFLHSLQSRFSRVRSFAFVSDLGEITETFRGLDASKAVDLAVAGRAINLYANSNYGRAFALFAGAHLGAISRRTTVLIIGDGRNNYNPANVWALEEIRRRAQRVVWICPEERSSWSFGDSEMALYERAVDRVLVVRNLRELERLSDSIVAGGARKA